jgi:hypothetical protein
MPGELTAFAKRQAASIPAPFAPTLPLQQGQCTIVIFYEHSWTEHRNRPQRLRYGFATLDAEGKTQVMSAEAFAHAHEPAALAAELVCEWDAEATRIAEELEQGHRDVARKLAKMDRDELSGEEEWVDGKEPEGLRIEVSSPEEVDELFEALDKNGRLVCDS